MVFATIYCYPNNPRLHRAFLAAKLNNLEISLPDFQFRVDNRTPEFLENFPLGKIPALSTPSGLHIVETAAIANYIADSGPARDQLLGSTAEERARIQQWLHQESCELFHPVADGARPKLSDLEYNAEVEEKALEKTRVFLTMMEKMLKKNQTSGWLAGTEKYSMADLAIAGTLGLAFQVWLTEEFRAEFGVVEEWYERLMKEEEVKEVFGKPLFGDDTKTQKGR